MWLAPCPDSFDVAAKVHEIANALRALKCANVSIGSTVVVTAATGAMGAATVKLAEHFGIARLALVGRDPQRLGGVARLAGVPTTTLALGELPEDWVTTGGLTRRLRELAPDGAAAVLDFIPDRPGTGQAIASIRGRRGAGLRVGAVRSVRVRGASRPISRSIRGLCAPSQPGRHARAHHHGTGHPIVASIVPGETWAYCLLDDTTVNAPAPVAHGPAAR